MKNENWTRLYIFNEDGQSEMIMIKPGEHHYTGYQQFLQTHKDLIEKHPSLKRLLNIKVSKNNGVLLSSKCFYELSKIGYLSIQTWTIPNNDCFFVKQSKIHNEAQENEVRELFNHWQIKPEHLRESNNNTFIYMSDTIPLESSKTI